MHVTMRARDGFKQYKLENTKYGWWIKDEAKRISLFKAPVLSDFLLLGAMYKFSFLLTYLHWVIFPLWNQRFELSLVWRSWLEWQEARRSVKKPVSLIPKGFLLEQVQEEN